MSAMIRVKAVVQPGGKVEATVPELADRAGQEVEFDVVVPTPAATDPPRLGIYDLIKSFPPGPRSAETFEEIERQFQAERDSWDR